MLKDLRLAVRMLLHAKGWGIVIILSLALGIGANTALFSAVNSLLLRELPVEDPKTLVRLQWTGRNDMATSLNEYGHLAAGADGEDLRSTFSYPMFQRFTAENRTMSDIFTCAPFGRVNAVVDGQAEIASSFISSGNYYQLLGVKARAGRTIVPEDDRPGAPPVALISSNYWQTRFAGDPGVVGKTVRINNVLVTIVGILPTDFTGVQQPDADPPDISIPLSLDPQLSASISFGGPDSGLPRLQQPTNWWLQIMGRLKPGATPAQVQGNLEANFQNTARAGLDSFLKALPEDERQTAVNRSRTEVPRLRVKPGGRGVYDVNTNDLRSVAILGVVVLLVLLIVCANVANLLLSRAITRQKELSVRLSLGATRSRLIRQLLTESLLLASIGGALGILVAYWSKQLLPGALGRVTMLDWRLLMFVLLITGLTGILFGIAPAFRGTGMDVIASLKDSSRSVVSSRSILSKSLVVVQVCISLVLLVGAGLFLRTLYNLRHVDIGFNPEKLLLFRVNPQLNRYDEKRTAALYGEMLDRIAAVPGVRAAGFSQPALLSGSTTSTSIFVQGRTYPPSGRQGNNSINRLVISPNFFDVMGIPILLGRRFTDRDTESSPKVVIINEAAVRKYFPNEFPIGRRFGSSIERAGQLEIVGVLRDAKYNSLRDAPPPTMYLPYRQTRTGMAVFEVRTAGIPAGVTSAVREAVRRIDPDLPMMDVSTQMEQIERRFTQERLFAQATALFGGLALLLASVGLFGLMSYNVARRTNEIGIRMALGAQRQEVLFQIMRDSLMLVAAGVAAGLAIAVVSVRLLETLLFGVAALDPVALGCAVLVMLLVSALAGYLPARRASRVDPMIALRYE
jgi:predicted permease